MSTPQGRTKFKDIAQCRALVLHPNAQGEKRFDTDFYVEGIAARYEPYVLYDDGDWGKTYERFERGCFDTTDMSDVIFQFDHAGRVFARNTNGTLVVEPNDEGLFMAADLSKTAQARDIHGDIVAKMLTKMSWRFRCGDYYSLLEVMDVEGSPEPWIRVTFNGGQSVYLTTSAPTSKSSR